MISDDCISLAARLGAKLKQRQLSISCAESCTGGGIAYAITSTSGSSAWFNQGVVTYSNQAKQQLLKVSKQTLDEQGAVSEQTVREMAIGCQQLSGADLAISVSGIAGPDGGTEDKPVGTVWFGFALGEDVLAELMLFEGSRAEVRIQSIDFALTRALELIESPVLQK